MIQGKTYYVLPFTTFAVAGCAMSQHIVAYAVELTYILQVEESGGTYIAMGI